MVQVNTQLAYILHRRNYRETSQILDVFTRDFGRLTLMSRGSRGAKSKIAGNLQVFSPLLIGWQGKGSMPNLRAVDRAEIKPPNLSHKSLLSAMYLNELLIYLLHKNDVYESVFDLYHQCLYGLENPSNIEIELRKFEITLLELLGFALLLDKNADSSEKLIAENYYQYVVEHGPVELEGANAISTIPVLQGETLLALASKNYSVITDDKDKMLQVKRLMRSVIGFHLGGKTLKSRELFFLPKSKV